uniref:Uncharacterized protein n=1 Tax=viral metagenome TaxID=1070528 RepID=A0A6M3IXF1_9ZZZZ
MPRWNPKPLWNGHDVYIIGGGPSLRSFDYSVLRGKHTIGCNDAFLHGFEICRACIFGDIPWFDAFEDRLKQFPGIVFTCARGFFVDWVYTIKNYPDGLHKDGVGWCGNTGAAALNLALLLGAKNVYLLGFDMKLDKEGRQNWHDKNINKPNPKVYSRFLNGFRGSVKRDWKAKFPGVEIFNLNPDSELDVFPKMARQDHFGLTAEVIVNGS